MAMPVRVAFDRRVSFAERLIALNEEESMLIIRLADVVSERKRIYVEAAREGFHISDGCGPRVFAAALIERLK